MIFSRLITQYCKGCKTEAQFRFMTNGHDVFSDCLNCEAISIAEMNFIEIEKAQEEFNQLEVV
jgi:hypothetical protein